MYLNKLVNRLFAFIAQLMGFLWDAAMIRSELELERSQLRQDIAELLRKLDQKTLEAEEGKRWRLIATTDAMTGIPNRLGALTYVAELLTKHGPFEATVVLGDGGSVKIFNDTLGHALGDILIEQYAFLTARSLRGGTAEEKLLRELYPDAFPVDSRPPDLGARWGGDEFLCVLPGPEEGAESAVARITSIMGRFLGQGLCLDLGYCHVQITCLEDFWAAVKRADAAMYKVKEARKAAEAAAAEAEAADSPPPNPQG